MGSKRILGVDIAKIVAMVFVVACHINGFGLCPFDGADSGLVFPIQKELCKALFASCVDIFAIASGFVGVASSFRVGRIFRLWARVVATGIVVLIGISFFTAIPVSYVDFFRACLPATYGQYWYITSYFMLCFAMPLLNAGIRTVSRRELRIVVWALLVCICGSKFFIGGGAFNMQDGYCFLWLMVMYIVGAYIRLYGPLRLPAFSLLVMICCMSIVSGLLPLAINAMPDTLFPVMLRRLSFIGYTSPFTVIIAVAVFMLCLKVQNVPEPLSRLIKAMSATSLGVYLVHVQPILWSSLFLPFAAGLKTTASCYLFKLSAVTIAVYIACSLVDYVRILACRGAMAIWRKWEARR